MIQNRITENTQNGNRQLWRKRLSLKPYDETARLNTAHCFFNEPWGQEEKNAPYPFWFIAMFFVIWTGVALLIIWRHPENVLIRFLVFILVSAGLMMPLGGYLTANWRRGALIHNRALILPDSGGILIQSDIQMKASRGASPWGAQVSFGRNEQGRINFRGQRNTDWSHDTMYPRLSVYASDADMMQLMGVFPDVTPDFNPPETPLAKKGAMKIPVTSQTVLWNGKQWRVLKSIVRGEPQWGQPKRVPSWLKDDEEWLRKLQALSPGTPWLCGRSVLPAGLQLRIQNGAISEVFWAMPYLKPLRAF